MALKEALERVQDERLQFLQSLTGNNMENEIHYKLLDGSKGVLPLWTLLRHAMNHSTYHRGQIAAMLRRVGVIPPPTDLLAHAMERE